MSQSDKHDEAPKMDRAWWRAQGIEACLDRLVLVAEQHRATIERERLANMRADQAEEARDAAKLELALSHDYTNEIKNEVFALKERLIAAQSARGRIEIRTNDDLTLDEAVGERISYHLEQMSATHWWMSLWVGNKDIHINLTSKATITARVSDESRVPSDSTSEREGKDG